MGIWFDRTPKPTLVWSANRDSPASAGSTIRLSFSGQLFLSYTNGTILSVYSGEAAALGFMQDNGNFVLRDGSSRVLWQSFDHPTDTILPTQYVAGGGKLYSNSREGSDCSTGRFMVEMQFDGNLVVSAYRFSDPGYWYSATTGLGNVSLLFNQSAFLQLVNGSNVNIYSLTRNLSDQVRDYRDYYHRAIIDDQGNLRQLVHHKTNTTAPGWTTIWKAVDEPCTVNVICGVNGFCFSPDNQTASCECIPGYTPLDPHDVSQGCRPETVLNYCGNATSAQNFTVAVIDDADFPFESFADLSRVNNVDLEGCMRALTEDCYSQAAALVGSRCVKKRMPLLNARRGSSSTKGIRALVKVPVKVTGGGVGLGEKSGKEFDVRRFLVVGLMVSGVVAVVCMFAAVYYHPGVRKMVERRRRWRKGGGGKDAIGITFRRFTYGELDEATRGFVDVIGRGSSANVYRGTLAFNKDLQIDIAVKRLKINIEQSEKEFTTELKVIGTTHHKNLVRLLGFCVDNNQRMLVYELMPNGTMSHIFELPQKPIWDLRAKMVLGIARGLSYLHEGCTKQIIHCDIKLHNILLDANYTAKIADFGLAKLLNKEQTRTDTHARGTIGYMAPEWLRNAPVTSKVDVYSFGVVMLEIICCRRQIEEDRVGEESEEEDLVLGDWVLGCLVKGKLEEVVGGEAEVVSDMKKFERMALVGLWCTHPDPFLRPSMRRVTQMLEGSVDVGVPPQVFDRISYDQIP